MAAFIEKEDEEIFGPTVLVSVITTVSGVCSFVSSAVHAWICSVGAIKGAYPSTPLNCGPDISLSCSADSEIAFSSFSGKLPSVSVNSSIASVRGKRKPNAA